MHRIPFYSHGILAGWRIYRDGLFGLVLVGVEMKKR